MELPELVEFGIVVSAQQNNTSILNPDFLKYNDIVSRDWLIQDGFSPVTSPVFSQVIYQNGIGITSLPDKIIFVQEFRKKDLVEPKTVADIAIRYLSLIKHVDYKQVGINPKFFTKLPPRNDSGKQFIVSYFMAPASWEDIGKSAPTAGLRIGFDLEDSVLSLNIEETKFPLFDQNESYGLMLAANFHRELEGNTRDEKNKSLLKLINKSDADVKFAEQIIREKILDKSIKACA